MSDELRRIPIHRALTRPQLVAGGEREPVLLIGLIAFILIMVGLSLPTTIAGIVIMMFGVPLLQRMAKADPNLTQVYFRHIRYKNQIGAKSTPWAIERQYNKKWVN